MLNAGEWVRLEQALSEVTVNHEHFPECLRHHDPVFRWHIANWDTIPLTTKVGVAAAWLLDDQSGPAVLIRKAYIKLCTDPQNSAK